MNWLKLFSIPVLTMGLATVLPNLAQAQITSAGDGTVVNLSGSTIDITGGTQAGSNLFHSFGQFNVNAGQTANFMNPGVQNILGRVTGGNASLINGVIQVSGGNANLYLMNPTGIIFGTGASLNVPSSFVATTANGIRIGNEWFNATGSNNYPALTGTPNALGFTMNQPGAIVNSGNLSVTRTNQLVLAGGTVVSSVPINSQGSIVLVAAPGDSFVRFAIPGNPLSLEVQSSSLAPSLPNNWTLPIASLPQLLTGGSAGSAYGVTVGSDGQVRITSSGARVGNGDVVVNGAIETSGGAFNPLPASDNSVNLYAANNIAINRVETVGNSVQLTARGNITTGQIYTGGIDRAQNSRIAIRSSNGNVQVATLDPGTGGIDVYAKGSFRATDSFPTSFFDIRTNNPSLIEYLVSLGYPRDQLNNIPSRTGTLPTSIIARPRGTTPSIRISTGDASQTIANGRGIEIRVDSQRPFVLGPAFSGNVVFIPSDPTKNVQPYDPVSNPNGFDITNPYVFTTRNGTALTYPSTAFPANASGTVGTVLIGAGGDAGLYASFQNRTFTPQVSPGTNPGGSTSGSTGNSASNPPSSSVSTLNAQVFQQETTTRGRQAACNASTTIASASIPETRSAGVSQNSCTSIGNSSNETQILKILEGDRETSQRN